jgi:tetratricopeptide (TPR) repeat protein
LDPDHFKAWFNLGSRYGKLQQNAKALPCFQKAVELRPGDVMAHYSLAFICNLLNMLEDSVKHYQEALKINPNFARAHSNLATVHYSVKQGKEAIHHLRIAKKLFEEQGELHMVETAGSLLDECYKEFNMTPEDFE